MKPSPIKLLFVALCLSVQFVNAQELTDDQRDVMQVVFRLFDGMREADSAKVHSVFHDPVMLYTVYGNEREERFKVDDLQGFLNAVGTPHDIVWDEPIWDYTVQIDGNLAHVWTNYAFYAGDKFSHCGVDDFQLFRTEDGWKVFSLADTRQRENCDLPPVEDMKRGL